MTKFLYRSVRAFMVILCLATPAGFAEAQASHDVRARMTVPDSAHIQIVTLRDGSTIFGRILAVNGDTVSFQTQAGNIQLSAGAIREIKEIPAADLREGEYWFPNPNSTRLFFAPSGQMLKKGEGYFSDYELFFPGIAYGVTDNVTIGGGVSLFPAAVEDQVYYVTPKIGISVADKVHVAAGVLFAGTKGGTGGIYYGVGTFGDGNASVTLGGGYGFAGGKIEAKPVGMIGGELRVSRRIGIVTENYLLPVSDNNFLYSFGLRFMGEKLTTDLALVNVSGSDVIGIPYVDFVFRF
ncbi:MAG: hypothetical protein DMD39_01270 [Gemmatimonadetes bacterium]|nr:MAG: hypothetical protein DMD39_01270 [Gemmatimonadota bacterium]